MINLSEKLRIAMIKMNVSQLQLAERSNQTRNNLGNKFARNDFKLSEYEKLVTALGCELKVTIKLPNGEEL